MRTLDCLLHLLLTVASLFQDTLRFMGAVLRSRSALMAENLFLRKQLVLYLERKVQPRRANDATRLTLVLLSRLFAWRQALTICPAGHLDSVASEGLPVAYPKALCGPICADGGQAVHIES